ncbi:MAG: type II toxin-antitoxin system PemK/MazF family toxin [Gallionella sp.]|nr:type II toxin-antitoxin system PemK/MazF family toxin [Gallionella sp.]
MKRAGQIALTPFPYTDLSGAKLRPVLLLRQASSRFDDWLVCMVSSQLQQADADLDEILLPSDINFAATGLKVPSVLRLSRLAVLDGALLVGCIGEIEADRLARVRQRLAHWVVDEQELR